MSLLRKVYTSIYFGNFEFNDGFSGLKQPLEWFVLDVDEVNNKVLLLSRSLVDLEGYANCPIFGNGYKTSWSTSYLRIWLNSDFFDKTFNAEEKTLICPTHISPMKRLHKKTLDRVFLLSETEYKKYFPDGYGKTYIRNISIITPKLVEVKFEKWDWWLRDVSEHDDSLVKCVSASGDEIFLADSNSNEHGVRPAMWVKYDEKLLFSLL